MREEAPVAVVVMGVSGCGKTVIGKGLARRLGARFLEGDAFHPKENVERMSSGLPLDDEMRAGWLDAIGTALAEKIAGEESAVVACSALKRIYRDRLRRFCPTTVFVYLEVDRDTARQRVGGRKGHFMPASLVDSQFAILDPPQIDETALTLDGRKPIEALVAEAATHFAD